jgi:hypothetical protein
MRAPIPPLAALAAVWCVALAPGTASGGSRPCDVMDVPGFTVPVVAPDAPPASDAALVPVSLPVVVHFMKLDGSSNDVSTKITPRMLLEHFGDAGAINVIWRQAAVRLYVQRFELCTFTADTIPLAGASHEEIASPARSVAARQRFRQIANDYNASDVRGVDLYVWWGIQREGGYADRWLETGPLRAGAAWVDTDCQAGPLPYCDLILAHEIGHFLGLCHGCTIGQAIPGVTCVRCLPETMRQPDGSFTLANCDEAPDVRLMRSDNLILFLPYTVTGTELSPCERRLANSFANARVKVTTNTRRNDMGGGGMGELKDTEKHVVMFECKGPIDPATAAKFTDELHKVLQKFNATITFDMTGDAD